LGIDAELGLSGAIGEGETGKNEDEPDDGTGLAPKLPTGLELEKPLLGPPVVGWG